MKRVTSRGEAWRAVAALEAQRPRFSTGLACWDVAATAPEADGGAEGERREGGLVWGAVHELLHGGSKEGGPPWFLAALLAGAASRACADVSRPVVWVEGVGDETDGARQQRVFAPAVLAAGVPWDRLVVLRARTLSQRLWGIAECLRCEAVAAVVAEVGVLSRLWARRLQLAAERGGGVGLLTREVRKAGVYAAATRWRVWPVPVEEALGEVVQRWGVARVWGSVAGDSAGGSAGESAFAVEVLRELGDVGRRGIGASSDVRAVPLVAAGASGASAEVGWRPRYVWKRHG